MGFCPHNLKVVGSNPTPATKQKSPLGPALSGIFLRQFARIAPPKIIPPNARQINAFVPRITVCRRVHVTRLAHGNRCLFAKRSGVTALWT